MVNVKRLPMPIMESYDWQNEGACRDVEPDAYFSPEAERGLRRVRREEAAKALCARCLVLDVCREHALTVQEPYGVWGGLSESERHELLQSTRAA